MIARPTVLVAALWLIAVAGCAPAARLSVDRDVAIPMRDGVVLRGDLYRPAGGGRFPVLIFRTPYGKHLAAGSDRVHRKALPGAPRLQCRDEIVVRNHGGHDTTW